MNTIPEHLIPLLKDLFEELQDKIPAKMMEQVAELIIRNFEYQEIRDSSSHGSQEALTEIQTALVPLQKWATTEESLWQSWDAKFATEQQTRFSNLMKEMQQVQLTFLGLEETLTQIQAHVQEAKNWQPVAIEQQRIQEYLRVNTPKLMQALDDLQQSSKLNHNLFESLEQQSAQLRPMLAKINEGVQSLSPNMSKTLESLQQLGPTLHKTWEALQQQFGPTLAKILESLQQLGPTLAKGWEALQQQLQQQSKQLPTLIQDMHQSWEKSLAKLMQEVTQVSKSLSAINFLPQLEGIFKDNPFIKLHHEITTISTQWAKFQELQEALLKKVQEDLAHQYKMACESIQITTQQKINEEIKQIHQFFGASQFEEIKATLAQFQEMMLNIKKIAQQLNSLPQQLQIPENFATIIESIPDTIKKVRDYLEHFRHDVTLIAEHDLELLKASREQTTGYAKFQTTILPEIQSLQQSWQKLTLKLENYWSSNQETFTKNMAELASVTSRIKLILEDIARQQQEQSHQPKIMGSEASSFEARRELSGQIQDIRKELAAELKKELASLIQEMHKEPSSLTSEIRTVIIQEMRKEATQIAQEIRKELITGINHALSEFSKTVLTELNRLIGSQLEPIKEDMIALEKHILDKIHSMDQILQTRMQNLEQTLQTRMQSIEQALQSKINSVHQTLGKLDDSIVRVEHRAMTNALDTRVSVKCPNCGQKVTGSLAYQGKRVECTSCNQSFTFPNLGKQ